MFNSIAGRYDLLNHLLSAGIDLYWRWRALARVRQEKPALVLDLATGTGDFALSSRRLCPQRIVGVDVAMNMLRLGRKKVSQKVAGREGIGDGGMVTEQSPSGLLSLLGGDAEQLPFASSSFDLVTAAFGVRNFGSIPAGLGETLRVLKPGGEVVILDFAEPRSPVFKQVYRFYFSRVLPLLGGIISGNRQAYSYLPKSVGTFPQGQSFLRLLTEAGFENAASATLTLGIVSVYHANKPQATQ